MPIKTIADPAATRSLASATFASIPLPTDPEFVAAPVGPAEFGALPLYNLSSADLIKGMLGGATLTGWRYVRVAADGKSGDLLEVSLGDEPALVSHAGGGAGVAIAAVCKRAVDSIDGVGTEFEARVLRIPEIGVEGLWLHPETPEEHDRFFGIPRSIMHLRDGEFSAHVVDLARDYSVRVAGTSIDGLAG